MHKAIIISGMKYVVIEADAYYYILKRLDTYYIVLHSSERIDQELGQSVLNQIRELGGTDVKINYILTYSYSTVDFIYNNS